jgi:uncharacterized C2H2 Zn-finger protein
VAYVEVGDSRICAITLRDRGEEMMRNPSCIVVLFHVNNFFHFFKEANKSNPLLVHYSLPNMSIKIF